MLLMPGTERDQFLPLSWPRLDAALVSVPQGRPPRTAINSPRTSDVSASTLGSNQVSQFPDHFPTSCLQKRMLMHWTNLPCHEYLLASIADQSN